MKAYENVTEMIGNTPLMALTRYARQHALGAHIYAKIEFFNPAGSAKDRIAKAMIEDAEIKGLLAPGAVIIEPTSGNTGIGLASVAAAKGYRVILTMPDTMSAERQTLIKAYGAQVVLTDGKKGMAGAIEKANELHASMPGSFVPGQFVNPVNALAHYRTTGPEIWGDTDGTIDIFVAGVGTGGTITGIGRYLKERNPAVRIVAVEPAGSPVLSGGKPGKHDLQGIGAGFVPEVLDVRVIDEIVPVSDEDAYRAARELGAQEGIVVGITSGAALRAATQLAKRAENNGKTIVVFLPDTGERYLTTALFSAE